MTYKRRVHTERKNSQKKARRVRWSQETRGAGQDEPSSAAMETTSPLSSPRVRRASPRGQQAPPTQPPSLPQPSPPPRVPPTQPPSLPQTSSPPPRVPPTQPPSRPQPSPPPRVPPTKPPSLPHQSSPPAPPSQPPPPAVPGPSHADFERQTRRAPTREARELLLQTGVEPPPQPRTLIATRAELDTLVEGIKCPKNTCRSKLTVTATECSTGGTKLQVVCTKCKGLVTSCSTATHSYQGKTYSTSEIRQVYFCLITDIGYTGLKMYQTMVTGGEMSLATFTGHCSYLYKRMETFYNEKMEGCRAAVFKYYREVLNREPDENGLLDVDVNFGCSWKNREHRSHISVGLAVEVNLGMVVDLDILCNNCSECSTEKQHECHRNFEGNSEAMEAEIAVRIWSRTMNYKMRFSTYVCDGDSSAYDAICRLNDGRGPYEVPVIKEECVNNVSKRMGARLRKLKNEDEAVTIKISERRKKSLLERTNILTDEVIDSLASYYGKALKDHTGSSVKTMQQTIWASYYHLTSTNDMPSHNFCPKDKKSWCFYQRAEALQLPESAKDHDPKELFLSKMPQKKLELIREVYKDLSDPVLLKRCLRGATQNPNASLHSKVRAKCPEVKPFDLFRVRFLVRHTALQYNYGYKEASILENMLGSDTSLQSPQKRKSRERSQRTTFKAKRKKTMKKNEKYPKDCPRRVKRILQPDLLLRNKKAMVVKKGQTHKDKTKKRHSPQEYYPLSIKTESDSLESKDSEEKNQPKDEMIQSCRDFSFNIKEEVEIKEENDYDFQD